jgi:integrase
MNDPTNAPTTGAVLDFPPVRNRGEWTVRDLVDAYMATYTGRDTSRVQRLAVWVELLGDRIAAQLDSDDVGGALEQIARTPALTYRRTENGPTLVTRGPRSGATINRFRTAFAAVLSWSKYRRLMPRGWASPVREVPAERENPGRLRFLSPDEQKRLLAIARVSRFKKLRLLILMAITTGARRGELLGLRHQDLDLEAGTAALARTKNGESRVLVLTDAVTAEVRRHGSGLPDALLFASKRRPEQPANVHTAWRCALKAAQIEGACFHTLRHTHASMLAQSGASLVEIADSMGHKSMTMVRRYAHLSIDSKRQLVTRVLGALE